MAVRYPAQYYRDRDLQRASLCTDRAGGFLQLISTERLVGTHYDVVRDILRDLNVTEDDLRSITFNNGSIGRFISSLKSNMRNYLEDILGGVDGVYLVDRLETTSGDSLKVREPSEVNEPLAVSLALDAGLKTALGTLARLYNRDIIPDASSEIREALYREHVDRLVETEPQSVVDEFEEKYSAFKQDLEKQEDESEDLRWILRRKVKCGPSSGRFVSGAEAHINAHNSRLDSLFSHLKSSGGSANVAAHIDAHNSRLDSMSSTMKTVGRSGAAAHIAAHQSRLDAMFAHLQPSSGRGSKHSLKCSEEADKEAEEELEKVEKKVSEIISESTKKTSPVESKLSPPLGTKQPAKSGCSDVHWSNSLEEAKLSMTVQQTSTKDLVGMAKKTVEILDAATKAAELANIALEEAARAAEQAAEELADAERAAEQAAEELAEAARAAEQAAKELAEAEENLKNLDVDFTEAERAVRQAEAALGKAVGYLTRIDYTKASPTSTRALDKARRALSEALKALEEARKKKEEAEKALEEARKKKEEADKALEEARKKKEEAEKASEEARRAPAAAKDALESARKSAELTTKLLSEVVSPATTLSVSLGDIGLKGGETELLYFFSIEHEGPLPEGFKDCTDKWMVGTIVNSIIHSAATNVHEINFVPSPLTMDPSGRFVDFRGYPPRVYKVDIFNPLQSVWSNFRQ